ncbi:MAG TPA: hypothetical protein VK163_01260 [Opitutaceae bacterium]|nr:hypothetical protein [Opitutaceae bacterium]
MSWPTANDPTNAAAAPVLDGWGWGEYWSADEWLVWHAAMKTAYGLAEANRRFLAAWNEQGIGASPLNARTFSVSFREYARANGFLSGIYGNAAPFGIVLNPVGSVGEASDAVAESVGGASSALKAVGPALLFVGVVALGYLYFRELAPKNA